MIIEAARTCFFNWLYARNQKGTFILRIEDTDMARSSEEMTEGIIKGPSFQSQRLSLYRQKAQELVEKGLVYKDVALDQSGNLYVLGGKFSENRSPDGENFLYSRANEGITLKKFRMVAKPQE